MNGPEDTQDVEQPLQYEEPKAAPQPEPEAAPEPPKPKQRAELVPEATDGGAPGWVTLPAGLRFPLNRQKIFFRFPSRWTFAPAAGIPLNRPETEAERAASGPSGLWRQVIVWPNGGGDTKLALMRAQGDQNRLTLELVKQMIRSIDGVAVTWATDIGPGSINDFWEQIGAPCQTLIRQMWNQLHSLDRDKLSLFIESYIEVRS